MKTFLLLAAGLGLAGASAVLPARDAAVIEAPASRTPPPSAVVEIDPAELFRRAFFQPPGAGDKIINAERREWADAEGIKRWRWFLVVEPSPELVKYLRDDNAFGLVPAPAVPPIEDAPAWFIIGPDQVDCLQAPRGGLRLFFNKTKPLLWATSGGTGFRPGAPATVKATPMGPSSEGRLPNLPPPKE
jgi:hypothetical protein